MTGVVVVLCRPPSAPDCKTRLAREVGPARAQQLYRRCVRHVLTVLQRLPVSVRLAVAGDPLALAPLCQEIGARDVELVRQVGATFQERQAHEISRALHDGHAPVALCASDLLELDERPVTWALAQAVAGRVGVVPSHDGGYSLLTSSVALPELVGVEMSTERTGTALVRVLAAAGHDVSVAPFEVPDLDVAADLPAEVI